MIPEDVLSSIFDLVLSAHCKPLPDERNSTCSRAFLILKLSQVNRQFRVVAISNPRLWTHISGSENHPEMALVNACLQRSQDQPLTVHLNIYLNSRYGPPSCDDVFTAARPHAHRWHAVRIRFVHKPHVPADLAVQPKHLKELQNITAPALKDLALVNDTSPLKEEFFFLATWQALALRSLTVVHGFPFQLRHICTISALDLTLSLRTTDFRALLALLSRMPNLVDLGIFLDNHQWSCTVFFVDEDIRFQNVSLDSVQRLRITAVVDSFSASLNVETAVFRALAFRNACDVTITLLYKRSDATISTSSTLLLFDEVVRLFNNDTFPEGPWKFPRVSNLNFHISSPKSNKGEVSFGAGSASLILPLHIFPALKELRVESNMLLDFGTSGHEHRQPALRRIELVVPRLKSSRSSSTGSPSPDPTTPDWCRELAMTLLAQGLWHDFVEFVLTERPASADLDINRDDSDRRWNVKRVITREAILREFSGGFS